MTLIYKIELLCARTEVEALGACLEPFADAIAAFEVVPGGPWRLEAYATEPPDPEAVAKALPGRAHDVIALPAGGWLERNRGDFPAQALGRFHVRGSHLPRPSADGRIDLMIDAATAFGSGEHATTRGCLQAIDRLGRARAPRRALDLGCGSGILAIAIAKRFGRPVAASDLDHEAVKVTRANARLNGVGALVRARQGDGLARRAVGGGRYDLIVANILAGPLIKLAPAFARRLAPAGRLVLSGLLETQESQVVAAQVGQRLALAGRWRADGWSALTFVRRRGATSSGSRSRP
jgi:ribosomal protein L11 methyltransferase